MLPAQPSRTVEITITALHQSGNWISTLAGRAAKGVQHCEAPQRADLEGRAHVLCSAAYGCAVEIPIAAAHELCGWTGAFTRSAAKRVQRYYDSKGRPEDCAHEVRS